MKSMPRMRFDLRLITHGGFALAALLGVVLAQAFQHFPPTRISALVAIGFLVLSLLARLPTWVRLTCFGIFGLCLAMAQAQSHLQARWPSALDGTDHRLQLRVVSLPVPLDDGVRFDAVVATPKNGDIVSENKITAAGHATVAAHTNESAAVLALAKGRMRLSWYQTDQSIQPGDVIDATVRLRAPRGTRNPGGFDFERHALTRNLLAVGYLRDVHATTETPTSERLLRARARLSASIHKAVQDPTQAALLAALTVGDQRGLDESIWEVLRATGTGHLISISGLHLGLVAGLGILLTRLLYRMRPQFGLRCPRPIAESILGLFFAFAYSLAAGFDLPVLRALIMIVAVLLARFWRRSVSPWSGLALATLILLLHDTSIVLGASFWLSFIGVFWLAWLVRASTPTWGAAIKQLIVLQLILSLALLPLGAWFFAQGSVVGPLTNLLAIPWVNFLVVPVALLGAVLATFSAGVAGLFFQTAALALSGLWSVLSWFAQLPMAQFYFPEQPGWLIALALVGIFLTTMPKALRLRFLGLGLIVPLFAWHPPTLQRGEIEITQLDVGQGSAYLIRTAHSALIYDTGPKFRGGLDSGEAVVVPAARALGLHRVDGLITSHGDMDHAGGEESVMASLRPHLRLSGHVDARYQRCEAGRTWQLDGVRWRILHPPAEFPDLDNDTSCVLRVDNGRSSILFTGDISDLIESRLIDAQGDPRSGQTLQSTILVAPHHGSKTGSSPAFIDAVDPKWALISAGHNSRFGHPAPEVVQRYQSRDIVIIDTATRGATRIVLKADGGVEVQQGSRDAKRRYWTQ